MERASTIYLTCKLTRSGFSTERVFRSEQADGQECIGAAPVHYCWTLDGEKIGDDVPKRGESILGLVAGHILANGGGTAQVELPDGQLIEVPTAQLVSMSVERYSNVPVRS